MLPASRSRAIGESPRSGCSRSAASPSDACAARTTAGRQQHCDDRIEAILRSAVVGRAHERDHVAVGLLDEAPEHFHA